MGTGVVHLFHFSKCRRHLQHQTVDPVYKIISLKDSSYNDNRVNHLLGCVRQMEHVENLISVNLVDAQCVKKVMEFMLRFAYSQRYFGIVCDYTLTHFIPRTRSSLRSNHSKIVSIEYILY